MGYREESPEALRSFLIYMEAVLGRSPKTVHEYFLDLRLFLRFLKQQKGLVPPETNIEDISISDIDVAFLKSISLIDIYDFLAYLSSDRYFIPPRAKQTESFGRTNKKKRDAGIGPAARARKVTSIRAFFNYLTVKAALLEENPAAHLDSPKQPKSLPLYLSLDESLTLLQSISGENAERDFCIITLFLNCGLRVSELVGIDLSDIKDDALTVTGKGDKQRVVYLNEACRSAISEYLPIRSSYVDKDEKALFVTIRRQRISPVTVKWLIKKRLGDAGLDTEKYSAHKLRHTAATLMYQYGVDILTLKEVLGHEQLNTTQIYTHVSNEDLRRASEATALANVEPNIRKRKDEDEKKD